MQVILYVLTMSKAFLLGILFLFLLASSISFVSGDQQGEAVVGIKIYDYKDDFKKLFDTFSELGINTVFASESLVSNSIFREQAKTHRMPIFVIEPIFYNPEALKADPDLYAITRTGEQAKEDWVEFVCPSRDQYRKQKIESVRTFISKFQPDGLSLDFIRFFVFWEMVRPERTYESLPNTCFCQNCLNKFSVATGVVIPSEARATPKLAAAWIEAHELERWTEWKSGVITSMVKELVSAAKKAQPGILINIHALPWRKDDYNGAIKKVAGQNFASLSTFTDYLSPMCYQSMLHRDAPWIHSVVEDISSVRGSHVLPSIQVAAAYPDDLPVTISNFEESVKAAFKPPSQGIVFWSWDHLSKDPAKMEVLKRMFRSR
jgi:hypothetical protein